MSNNVVQEFHAAHAARMSGRRCGAGRGGGVCPECACAARCAPDGSLNHPPPAPAEKAAFHAPVRVSVEQAHAAAWPGAIALRHGALSGRHADGPR